MSLVPLFRFDPCVAVPDYLLNKALRRVAEGWRPDMNSRHASSEQDNVVTLFRPVQTRPRLVDPDLAEYMKKVNVAMFEKAGVHYLAIRSSLHNDDLDAIRSYMDRAVEPVVAVSEIMDAHGLKSVTSKISADLAGAYNKVQAAISEYEASSDAWHRAADGRIYSQIDGGLALMYPVRYRKESPNEPENFGFGIEIRDGASIDFYSGAIANVGEDGEKFAGWDLDRPLESMAKHIASREEANGFTF